VTPNNISGHVSLRFFEAMKAEHCSMAGCDLQFSKDGKKGSKNHSPKEEWQLVMEREGNGDKWNGKRRIPDIKELMELESRRLAGLIKEEVIAIVLYSGPMVSASGILSNCSNQDHPCLHC
jgi:hypothetical protein